MSDKKKIKTDEAIAGTLVIIFAGALLVWACLALVGVILGV